MLRGKYFLFFSSPRVVENDVDDNSASLADLMDNTKNETVSETGDAVLTIDPVINKGPITFEVLDKPPSIVQLMPQFFGGEEALYKWLAENIKFPQLAREAGISGTIVVTFVVENDYQEFLL